jgi:hypothetical protein
LVGEEILYFPKKDRVKQLVDIYLMGLYNPQAEKSLPSDLSTPS